MNPDKSHKILIADDEPDVLRLVASNLKSAGFSVIEAEDGPGALEKARNERPVLIILDLMLPGMPGLEVCKTLKAHEETAKIPIVMLTAKTEEVDRIVGFELGADDYITKPFSPRELVLRVKSILRRIVAQDAPVETLQVGDITLDRYGHTVYVKGVKIPLTTTEVKLLSLLMERRGRVQSRDTLLRDVWAYESSVDSRTVDTHVKRLRNKLHSAANCLETVRGFGYRILDGNPGKS